MSGVCGSFSALERCKTPNDSAELQEDESLSDQKQQEASAASTRFAVTDSRSRNSTDVTDTQQVQMREKQGENIWILNRNQMISFSFKQNSL